MRNPDSEADGAPSAGDGRNSPDRATVDQWVPLVYDELRALAHRARQGEPQDASVTTTALVHEAYLKLTASRHAEWPRAHFFGVAARAMRQVLVDFARTRRAAKRGAGRAPLTLDDNLVADEQAEGIVELDEALRLLEDVSPRLVRVVECRFFGGLTENETAEVLGLTSRTVRRDWVKAKGWLNQTLYGR
jgi:RNA polymerase sigma factor (TIGR02999 family)